MENSFKTCPDCSETVRAAAPKCRFCAFRFDAPKASRLPRTLLVLGVVLAFSGLASITMLGVSAVTLFAGVLSLVMQRRSRRARRWLATGRHARLAPVLPLAVFTTLRGH
jgi:hypothetical protein